MILLDRWTEIVNYLRNRKFATVEEMNLIYQDLL